MQTAVLAAMGRAGDAQAREFGGETFSSGSSEALAGAVLRWADSPARLSPIERAAAVSSRYSWEAVFTRMLGHYGEIVAAQRAGHAQLSNADP